MEPREPLPRNLFPPIFVSFVGLFALLTSGLYFGVPEVIRQMAALSPGTASGGGTEAVAGPWQGPWLHVLWMTASALGAGLLVFGLLLWLWQRRVVRFQPPADAPPVRAAAPGAARQAAAGEDAHAERVFLHLLTVLQQEGRLIDFFSEDLTGYADDQIGAAVREIHANCKGALEKYIALAAVVPTPEGAPYTVQPGFDPAAIKLTGNVTGSPPFTGVVRHQGWQTEKVRMPTLSEAPGQRVLAPAEIEIA